jgi:predicted phosphodiesterase
MVDHEPANFPLRGYQRREDGTWQIALAHGHYVPDGEETYRSSPIPQSAIGELGCDFLALGHWHRFEDVSHNGVPAFYCGSPAEPGMPNQSANLITLDPLHGISVDRVPLPVYDGPMR